MTVKAKRKRYKLRRAAPADRLLSFLRSGLEWNETVLKLNAEMEAKTDVHGAKTVSERT